jgi:hypothetical protein
MVFEVLFEPFLVGREAQEPVVLREPLKLDGRMVRAAPALRGFVHVRRSLEALGGAIPALVVTDVDVAFGVGPADHFLRGENVVRIARPDEAVGADEEGVLRRLVERDVFVDEFLGRLAELSGPLGDVHGVLVDAGQESRPIALHAVPSSQDVRSDDLVQGMEAGAIVGVGDGSCDVEAIDRAHGARW